MTSDTGLTNRLRQHSRRGGLAIALVMAATTAICIGGFAVLYAQLQPFISDFVSQEPADDDAIAFNVGRDDDRPTAEPEADEVDEAAEEEAAEPPPDEADDAPAEEAPPPAPTEPPAPTPTPAGFLPDYQLRGEGPVNLRAGPGTEFEVVKVLFPLEPLLFLGNEQPTANPAEDGPVWMNFRTEDGLEGWVRQVDVETYDPNA